MLIQALDARQFFDVFYDKHKRTVAKLEKEMINVAFSVFTCGLKLIEEEHVSEHCREVHGLVDGITSLSPLQVIEVDVNEPFTCPSLHKIEDFGPDKRKQLATSLYYS